MGAPERSERAATEAASVCAAGHSACNTVPTIPGGASRAGCRGRVTKGTRRCRVPSVSRLAGGCVLPSIRGILSGGNYKILKVTSGRSRANCGARNGKAGNTQNRHRFDMAYYLIHREPPGEPRRSLQALGLVVARRCGRLRTPLRRRESCGRVAAFGFRSRSGWRRRSGHR